MRVDLTDDEMASAARDQIALMLGACQRFDAGDDREHLNIATRLRVLLHHTRRSKAVLEYFGVFDKPWFVSSGGDVVDADNLPKTCLVLMAETAWVPRFDQFGAKPPLPLSLQIRYHSRGWSISRGGGSDREYSDWWTQVVIRDAHRNQHTREDLVLRVANQDGGAHVDRSLDQLHHRLSRANAV